MSTPGYTLDFESGTDNAALAAGSGVTAVSGTTSYTATGKKHGSLGVTGVGISNTSPSFTVGKPAGFASNDFTLSLYAQPLTVPGGALNLLSIQNASNAIFGLVRFHSDGHIDITSNSGTRLTASTLSWVANTWYRLDIQFVASTLVTTVRIFAGGNAEGTTADETISAAITSQTGGYGKWMFSTGRASTAGANSNLDTIRAYDGIQTPDPFAPPPPDTTAPSVPTGVTATANSSSQVTVNWTASTDDVAVVSYRVRRGGVDVTGATAVVGTSFVDTTVSPSVTYSYTVSAVDQAGNRSAESSAASATTPSGTGSVAHTWVGASTASGFTVGGRFTGTTSIRLAVSTSATMSGATTTAVVTPDANGYLKAAVTGLAANTQFYYQFQDTPSGGSATGIGTVGKAKTLPAVGSQASFSFALSSCITTNAADPAAMDDLRTWAPLFNVFTGDFHYKGLTATDTLTHLNGYRDQIAGAAGVAAMIRDVPMYYCTSDHEAGADNGDSNNAWTAASIDAYKTVVPHLPLPDANSPQHARYQTWVVGRVRFIMVDVRNIDRTAGLTADSSSKTMLGAAQKAWLKARLSDPEPVKVIISDPAWMGAASTANGEDKWWSYATERQEIADYITSRGIRVVFMHGDTHCLGVATPAKNTWGNFPVYCGSPMHNTGGGRNLTAFSSYYNNAGGNMRGYGRVSVVDSGSTISFTYSGWDASAGVQRVTQTDTFTVPAARKIRVGANQPNALYVGTTGVSRAYVGATQVWP